MILALIWLRQIDLGGDSAKPTLHEREITVDLDFDRIS
jgi:hypothetical protein